ncbi:MAG: hypothetical protein KJ718_06260 [Nanoarchaeota archaeon]|nr:hypothetical protein [Nanoarchaeota archaeon]MBU1052124.1 hypothetical protein [Nanoarchaeota archaeon]MBU1988602.1 hypothetical protein [Nanoarchaeota archaeon]
MLEKKFYKVGFYIILVLLIFSLLLFFFNKFTQCPKCGQCEACPAMEEEALMESLVSSWGKNAFNESEVLFNVAVYNYGYQEARNIVIQCNVYNTDEMGYLVDNTPVVRVSENVGTVGSTSAKTIELMKSNPPNFLDSATAFCDIISCDNCEILNDRIPELTEFSPA